MSIDAASANCLPEFLGILRTVQFWRKLPQAAQINNRARPRSCGLRILRLAYGSLRLWLAGLSQLS